MITYIQMLTYVNTRIYIHIHVCDDTHVHIQTHILIYIKTHIRESLDDIIFFATANFLVFACFVISY